jgi:nucleoside-diphosphate-sugar epimerase
MTRPRLLVTGGSGFVGSAVIAQALSDSTWEVRASVRNHAPDHAGVEQVLVGDLSAQTDWRRAVTGVDTIVHTAARVHVMHDRNADPLNEYRRVNVEGTLNLARQADDAGVRRFIFLSSIKVNGERTLFQPYTADDAPAPLDPYGISKFEAEQRLRRIAQETRMEVVIIRPVLVYGPGVKANFHTLMRWLYRGVPLPLAAISNRRSLVAIENLVDLLLTCARHPAAGNQTFLVSDGEDLSTPTLLRRLSHALGRPAKLFPVPTALLTTGARILGRGDAAQRLCGSLQVDISKTRELLDWSPPVNVDTTLKRTAQYFLMKATGNPPL